MGVCSRCVYVFESVALLALVLVWQVEELWWCLAALHIMYSMHHSALKQAQRTAAVLSGQEVCGCAFTTQPALPAEAASAHSCQDQVLLFNTPSFFVCGREVFMPCRLFACL